MNTREGSLFLLQGMFLTQELNRGLLHCRWILYQLSHQGSPLFYEIFAFSFLSMKVTILLERFWN